MSEAGNNGNGETQNQQYDIHRQIPGFPRDLLQRLMSKSHVCPKTQKNTEKSNGEDDEQEEEEMELSLGLSSNGRFGIDPLAKTKLTRSSSIPDFIINNSVKSSENSCFEHVSGQAGGGGLIRTCSMPTETEEEWRKRKELQSLRRLEAKRKRSEKQKTIRALRENKHRAGLGEKLLEDATSKREEGSMGSSSGSGSSGLSELDSNSPVEAANKSSDTQSPSSVQSAPENPDTFTGRSVENSTNKETPMAATVPAAQVKDSVRNILANMPCVSTKGDGPNGKRIEGFLYRYRKGEEVRIVCVCHGSFLSPAEFVKHAGGGDVAHPLKHIVVNPSPFL